MSKYICQTTKCQYIKCQTLKIVKSIKNKTKNVRRKYIVLCSIYFRPNAVHPPEKISQTDSVLVFSKVAMFPLLGSCTISTLFSFFKFQTSWSIKKSLKTEMALFEATGGKQMGEYLKMLFDALKNIAPTSIASEQVFSIATDFIPKKRSRLSDQAIDDLIFEKGYFEMKEGLLSN